MGCQQLRLITPLGGMKYLEFLLFWLDPALVMAKELGIPRCLAGPAFVMAKELAISRFGGHFQAFTQVGANLDGSGRT